MARGRASLTHREDALSSQRLRDKRLAAELGSSFPEEILPGCFTITSWCFLAAEAK